MNLSPSEISNPDPQSEDESQRDRRTETKSGKPKTNFYPPWAPRFWNGMRFSDFFRLLSEGRYRFSLSRIPSLFPITGCAVGSSMLTIAQKLRYRRKIAEAELAGPPLFVIGHWRTGTTLLHELLCQDKRFTFPTTFDCFTPHHFLFSRPFLYWLVKILIPSRRPMDNMSLAVDLPQECDFALAALSAPTPYRRIAFPNDIDSHIDLLSTEKLTEEQLERLHLCLDGFYKALTVREEKRLVLKSPPHTGRMEKLAEWFPGSQFVHLSRHPYSVVPSTIHLWKSLDYYQGFQDPKYTDDELLEFVLDSFEAMYSSYFEQRKNMGEKELLEIRFEDFVKDPVTMTESIYGHFDLPDFEQARSAVVSSVESRNSHRMNPKKFDKRMREAIDSRLRHYMQQFGYHSDKTTEPKATAN